jgi:hypothetical protein
MPEDSDINIGTLDCPKNFKIIKIAIKNFEGIEISIKKHEPA